jgi:hypothetical protein
MLSKNSVVSVLKNLFYLRGWKVRESDVGDFILERDDETIFVLYAERTEDVLNMADAVADDRVLVVFDSQQDSKIASAAYELGFDLWDRSQLEREIGKTVLDACSIQGVQLSFELSDLYGADFAFDKDVSVKVNLPAASLLMTEREAVNAASKDGLKVVSTKLLFVPHWMYSYSLSIEKKFKNRSVCLKDDGTGLLNAITGERSDCATMQVSDSVNSPTENYEIKELDITKEDAYSRVLKYIVDKNKKEVRINELIGDTIVFEQKTFTPDPKDINLSLDLIYLPVWHINGEDGRFVELNAVTKQTVRSYNSEDVEFIA